MTYRKPRCEIDHYKKTKCLDGYSRRDEKDRSNITRHSKHDSSNTIAFFENALTLPLPTAPGSPGTQRYSQCPHPSAARRASSSAGLPALPGRHSEKCTAASRDISDGSPPAVAHPPDRADHHHDTSYTRSSCHRLRSSPAARLSQCCPPARRQ